MVQLDMLAILRLGPRIWPSIADNRRFWTSNADMFSAQISKCEFSDSAARARNRLMRSGTYAISTRMSDIVWVGQSWPEIVDIDTNTSRFAHDAQKSGSYSPCGAIRTVRGLQTRLHVPVRSSKGGFALADSSLSLRRIRTGRSWLLPK
jgi:hypothetical protein